MKLLLTVLLLVGLASAIHDKYLTRSNYDGYKVLRVNVDSEATAAHLNTLRFRDEYDFWTGIRVGHPTDIMTPPEFVEKLEADLKGLAVTTMVRNVQTLVDLEKIPAKPKDGQDDFFTEYHSYAEIQQFLEKLATQYEFASTEVIGQTYEGRDMTLLKLCQGGCGNKPAMWIDAGIHAREWIAPATALYMANEVASNQPDLLAKLDFYFLPSHNPDGYQFSRENTRLWRKTRADHNSLFGCIGTDANRNYGFQWNTGGSSNDKCSDTYHGPSAWSEIETQHVSNYLDGIKDQVKYYNSIHSYSQLMLIPWGYTNQLPADYDDLKSLADEGNAALYAVHQKTYEVGCIPCLLYIASGSSADWAHGVAEIPYTYSIELRDTGYYGFVLPPEQIIPTGEEVWAMHENIANQIISMYA